MNIVQNFIKGMTSQSHGQLDFERKKYIMNLNQNKHFEIDLQNTNSYINTAKLNSNNNNMIY